MMLDLIDTHYKYTTSDLCISFENFCIEIHLLKKKMYPVITVSCNFGNDYILCGLLTYSYPETHVIQGCERSHIGTQDG